MTLRRRPSYAAELVAKLHAERPDPGAGVLDALASVSNGNGHAPEND